jgi:hypothetical protein
MATVKTMTPMTAVTLCSSRSELSIILERRTKAAVPGGDAVKSWVLDEWSKTFECMAVLFLGYYLSQKRPTKTMKNLQQARIRDHNRFSDFYERTCALRK